MVAFDCSRCGKCCASFGAFIKIERKLTRLDYYCRDGINNELFLVHLESGYSEHAPPGSIGGNTEKGCPFMYRDPAAHATSCAVYATRPRICREFHCYRMVIYTPDNRECGRIMGRNELKTTDTALSQIWKEHIAPRMPPHDDIRWEKAVIAALAAHGYRGEPVA